MRPRLRLLYLLLGAAGAVVAVVLLLSRNGDGDGTRGLVEATIEVREGRPVGGIARIEVDEGGEVHITVTADVEDEVHVHGYDLMEDVAPDAPAEFSFTADRPGRFEIELEERELQIGEFTVRAG